MIDTFKQNIPLDKFFRDGTNFVIKRQSDYLSYPDFLKYFSDLKTITRHNLTIGINFTYGWMPTIFDFRSDNFDSAAYYGQSLPPFQCKVYHSLLSVVADVI